MGQLLPWDHPPLPHNQELPAHIAHSRPPLVYALLGNKLRPDKLAEGWRCGATTLERGKAPTASVPSSPGSNPCPAGVSPFHSPAKPYLLFLGQELSMQDVVVDAHCLEPQSEGALH